MQRLIVTKFGGSSLADARRLRQVAAILQADPARRFVVPSAPGKRDKTDTKVTDLLLCLWDALQSGETGEAEHAVLRSRFTDMAAELGVRRDMGQAVDEVFAHAKAGMSRDATASRGEYLNGLLLSDYLGWDFVDPADGICFDGNGRFLSEETNKKLGALLAGKTHAVIPGFYGAKPDGSIQTFSRGGSDITGAVVARAVQADLYENWTDVSGFLMADPRIVHQPNGIRTITYAELRELSYMGASVLHADAVFPVHRAGIPTNIRNTMDPEHPGTMIALDLPRSESEPTITGLAGKRGFTVISIEKAMMSAELSFGRQVLAVLEEHGVSFEHIPTGIDAMSVVVSGEALAPVRNKVLSTIMERTGADVLTVREHMSLIATVGRGMVHHCGTAARLFGAMSRAGINVRMIDQGSSELSIIVGVNDEDYEATIRAIYQEFVG